MAVWKMAVLVVVVVVVAAVVVKLKLNLLLICGAYSSCFPWFQVVDPMLRR